MEEGDRQLLQRALSSNRSRQRLANARAAGGSDPDWQDEQGWTEAGVCSLTIVCVLLLFNVFSYYSTCSLTIVCSLTVECVLLL